MKLLKEASALIVDDYEINLQVLKLIMVQFGLNPDIAVNGIEAVEKYQNSDYQIILMDLMMPEMDGFEATKKIRLTEKEKQKERAVIIAVSANYMQDETKKLDEAGFDDVMAKPFKYNDLKIILSKYFQL